mmetsp:Transcript_23648/g.80634  ORF Transcript_23648/g.80634 Transcript_23648/m.80634 type:complete len:287 (+) Transcript_23648:1679-2539(+)
MPSRIALRPLRRATPCCACPAQGTACFRRCWAHRLRARVTEHSPRAHQLRKRLPNARASFICQERSYGLPSGKGRKLGAIPWKMPNAPPRPPQFPASRSTGYPVVSFVTRPSSLKMRDDTCGVMSIVFPVASKRRNFSVCVPMPRPKNHTRLGSVGSTVNPKKRSSRSGIADFMSNEPKMFTKSSLGSFTTGRTMKNSSASSSGLSHPKLAASTSFAFTMSCSGLIGKEDDASALASSTTPVVCAAAAATTARRCSGARAPRWIARRDCGEARCAPSAMAPTTVRL